MTPFSGRTGRFRLIADITWDGSIFVCARVNFPPAGTVSGIAWPDAYKSSSVELEPLAWSVEMPEGEQTDLYNLLLNRHLGFYDSLRTRARHPKTAAQRQFQDVAWGKAEPATEHEKAYVYHLKKTGQFPRPFAPRHIDESAFDEYPPGCRPISFEVAKKWDEKWVD